MIILADATGDLTIGCNNDGQAPCLPISRWADTVGALTSRADGWDNIWSYFKAIPMNLESIMLSAGNNLWSLIAWFQSAFSSQSSKVMDKFGQAVNAIAGAFYDGLTGADSGAGGSFYIVALILIAALLPGLVTLVRTGNHRVLTSKVAAVTIGLSLFISMGAVSADNPDKAAPGTPWWLAKTTNSIIADIGGGIGATILTQYQKSGTFLSRDSSDAKTGDLLSCRNYLGELDRQELNTSEAKNTVLMAVNTMWEESGLRLWARAQYGAGANGMQVFCRIPEYRAGVTANEMASLTTNAVNHSGGGPVIFRNDALAFNPNWWNPAIKGDKDDDDSTSATSGDDATLDRWMVMWDTCGYGKLRKSLAVRSGWGWVNNIGGKDRGVDDTGKKSSRTSNLVKQCAAAFMGEPNATDGRTHNQRNDDLLVPTNTSAGDAVDVNDNMKALINKFNIPTNSGWAAVAQAYAADTGELNDSKHTQVNDSITTLHQQRGAPSVSDTGAAFVFVLSSIVNLLIWGIGFGIIRLLTCAASVLIAGFGIYLGFLLYAICPEKGKVGLTNAFKQMLACCASSTILGIVASIGCLFINTGMLALGIFDNEGNTSGTCFALVLAGAILPIVYFYALRYLCVNIWKIGDPFSGNGIFKLIGGQAMMNGMKAVSNALGGALTAGAGALLGGAGLKGALGMAARGLAGGLPGPHARGGGMLGNLLRARDQYRHMAAEDKFLNGSRGGGPKHGSKADKAATEPDKPTTKPNSKNKHTTKPADPLAARRQAILDQLRKNPANKGKTEAELNALADKQLEREGLGGKKKTDAAKNGYTADEYAKAFKAQRDKIRARLAADPANSDKNAKELDALADKAMLEDTNRDIVAGAARRLHADALENALTGSSEYRKAYRDRRREIMDQLRSQYTGVDEKTLGLMADRQLKGTDEQRLLRERALTATNGYREAYAAQEKQVRERLTAQGLTGDALDSAVAAEMSSNAMQTTLRTQAGEAMLASLTGQANHRSLAGRYNAQLNAGHNTLASAVLAGGETLARTAGGIAQSAGKLVRDHPVAATALAFATLPASAPAMAATAAAGIALTHSATNAKGLLHRGGATVGRFAGDVANKAMATASDIAANVNIPHPNIGAAFTRAANSPLGRAVANTRAAQTITLGVGDMMHTLHRGASAASTVAGNATSTVAANATETVRTAATTFRTTFTDQPGPANGAAITDLASPDTTPIATRVYGENLTQRLVDNGMNGFAQAGIPDEVANVIVRNTHDGTERQLANVGAQAMTNMMLDGRAGGLDPNQTLARVHTMLTGQLHLSDEEAAQAMRGAQLAYAPTDSAALSAAQAVNPNHWQGAYGDYADRAAKAGITLEYADGAAFDKDSPVYRMADQSAYHAAAHVGAQMGLNAVMHGDAADLQTSVDIIRPQLEQLGMNGAELDTALDAAGYVIANAPQTDADIPMPNGADADRYRQGIEQAVADREEELRRRGLDGDELERQMRIYRADPTPSGLTQDAILRYNEGLDQADRISAGQTIIPAFRTNAQHLSSPAEAKQTANQAATTAATTRADLDRTARPDPLDWLENTPPVNAATASAFANLFTQATGNTADYKSARDLFRNNPREAYRLLSEQVGGIDPQTFVDAMAETDRKGDTDDAALAHRLGLD